MRGGEITAASTIGNDHLKIRSNHVRKSTVKKLLIAIRSGTLRRVEDRYVHDGTDVSRKIRTLVEEGIVAETPDGPPKLLPRATPRGTIEEQLAALADGRTCWLQGSFYYNPQTGEVHVQYLRSETSVVWDEDRLWSADGKLLVG